MSGGRQADNVLAMLQQWRERRLLVRRPVADADWAHALAHCAPARRLGASDQARLRVLVTWFLDRKSIEPVKGLELGSADRVLLATHACMPILKLDMDWYRGWYSVIVYPAGFMPRHQRVDAAGVVHESSQVLAGEAWLRGPVVLSWSDVLDAASPPGRNVVIHELAHKLDMLDGSPNGLPPLHKGMDQRTWSRVFTQAWERLHAEREAGMALPIDAYALENPGEFFAVLSEYFFENPALLRDVLPLVHEQLARFYRQHPS